MNSIPTNAKKVFKWKIFDIYQREQEMFDGSTKIFEKLKRNNSIDIIALSKDNKIYLIEETQPQREIFYWLIWWTCENWETPLETAKRELLEETWFISNNWELFWTYRLSSKIDYTSNIFIARNCLKIQNQNLDSGEKIKIIETDWKSFLDIIANPKFRVNEFALDILREMYLWREEYIKNKILKKNI